MHTEVLDTVALDEQKTEKLNEETAPLAEATASLYVEDNTLLQNPKQSSVEETEMLKIEGQRVQTVDINRTTPLPDG